MADVSRLSAAAGAARRAGAREGLYYPLARAPGARSGAGAALVPSPRARARCRELLFLARVRACAVWCRRRCSASDRYPGWPQYPPLL